MLDCTHQSRGLQPVVPAPLLFSVSQFLAVIAGTAPVPSSLHHHVFGRLPTGAATAGDSICHETPKRRQYSFGTVGSYWLLQHSPGTSSRTPTTRESDCSFAHSRLHSRRPALGSTKSLSDFLNAISPTADGTATWLLLVRFFQQATSCCGPARAGVSCNGWWVPAFPQCWGSVAPRLSGVPGPNQSSGLEERTNPAMCLLSRPNFGPSFASFAASTPYWGPLKQPDKQDLACLLQGEDCAGGRVGDRFGVWPRWLSHLRVVSMGWERQGPTWIAIKRPKTIHLVHAYFTPILAPLAASVLLMSDPRV